MIASLQCDFLYGGDFRHCLAQAKEIGDLMRDPNVRVFDDHCASTDEDTIVGVTGMTLLNGEVLLRKRCGFRRDR